MPSRPSNIKSLEGPEALHVINQLFRELHGRLDDLEKKVPSHQHIKNSGSLVFGTVPAQGAVEATFFITGANTGGTVHASPAQGLNIGNDNLIWAARVAGQNVVKVRLMNPTGAPVTVNPIKWNITVIQ